MSNLMNRIESFTFFNHNRRVVIVRLDDLETGTRFSQMYSYNEMHMLQDSNVNLVELTKKRFAEELKKGQPDGL